MQHKCGAVLPQWVLSNNNVQIIQPQFRVMASIFEEILHDLHHARACGDTFTEPKLLHVRGFRAIALQQP